MKIDVSKPDSIRRAAEEFSKTSDRLDTLVNNAGILLDDDKEILTITPEIFETTLRTNTLGALLVSQAFVSFLKKSDAPRIVNVSSGGGQLTDGADGWAPAYCISKTALNGVTVQLAAAITEVRGKFRLSGLGPHRHGRFECYSLGRRRRLGHRLVRCRCASARDWEVLA